MPRTAIGVDVFTESADVALGSHTPNTGTSWSVLNSGTLTVRGATDRLEEGAANNGNRALIAPAASTADVDVEADLTYRGGTSPFLFGGIIARWQVAGGHRVEGYFEPGVGANGAYTLENTLAGTLVRRELDAAWTPNTARRFRIECRGGQSQLFVDGVLQLTHTAPYDETGTKGGVVLGNFSGIVGAWALDNFDLYEITGLSGVNASFHRRQRRILSEI